MFFFQICMGCCPKNDSSKISSSSAPCDSNIYCLLFPCGGTINWSRADGSCIMWIINTRFVPANRYSWRLMDLLVSFSQYTLWIDTGVLLYRWHCSWLSLSLVPSAHFSLTISQNHHRILQLPPRTNLSPRYPTKRTSTLTSMIHEIH